MTMKIKMVLEKRSKLIINCLIASFSFAFLILSSLSSFNSKNTRIFAISNSIAIQSQTNIKNKTFSLITIQDEKAKNIINGIFNSEYSSNFNGNTELMTYVNSDGTLYHFDLKCGNSSLNNSTWCDLNTYSNQTDFKRFEKININLYKTPNRAEEINHYGTDGFIYIPDYFADKIIEESEGELTSYDSLIPDLSSYSDEKRTTFLNKYCVCLTNPKGVLEKYKIANIFHVNGFKDGDYVYNDSDSRVLIQYFLGNYAFIHSNKDPFEPSNKALLTIFESKRLIISERISSFLNYQSTIRFYRVGVNGSESLIKENEKITEILSSKKDINVFCHVTSIVCFLLFVAILFLCFKKKILLPKLHFLVALSIIVSISFFFQILSITVFATSITFYQIYNISFNISLLLIAGALIVFYFIGRARINE